MWEDAYVDAFAPLSTSHLHLSSEWQFIVWNYSFTKRFAIFIHNPRGVGRYFSCMSQKFSLFHVSNLSVRNFLFFLLMYTGSVTPQRSGAATAAAETVVFPAGLELILRRRCAVSGVTSDERRGAVSCGTGTGWDGCRVGPGLTRARRSRCRIRRETGGEGAWEAGTAGWVGRCRRWTYPTGSVSG